MDEVIFVTRYGKVARKVAKSLIESLEETGANILGVVLNDLPEKKTPGYYYSGYYGYGYFRYKYYNKYYGKARFPRKFKVKTLSRVRLFQNMLCQLQLGQLQRQLRSCGRLSDKVLTDFSELGDASRGNPLNYENVSGLVEAGVVRVYESAGLPLVALPAETFA